MICMYICLCLCDSLRRRCMRCLAVSLAGWCLHANLRCFLRAVYGNVVFYGVFWEPFMGMSCFYAVSLQAGEVRLHFYRVCWQPFIEPFMGMSCFTVFSESRLWECRVFTVFAYRQVRFHCIFTGFADNRFAVSLAGWCLNANLQCFLRAIYGNVVFYNVFGQPFMGWSCFYAVSLQAGEVRLHAFLPGLLTTIYRAVYGNVVFYGVFWEPFMGMSCFYAVSL